MNIFIYICIYIYIYKAGCGPPQRNINRAEPNRKKGGVWGGEAPQQRNEEPGGVWGAGPFLLFKYLHLNGYVCPRRLFPEAFCLKPSTFA